MFWSKKCQHKYGKVDDRDLQYCEFCGEARRVEPQECGHKWEMIDIKERVSTMHGGTLGIMCILRCIKCGGIKILNVPERK